MLPADLVKVVSPEIRAFLDYTATLAGVVEDPPGSNRGPDIDAWAQEFGSPLGSYWCALMVGHTRAKHGLWLPPRRELVGSCDEWYKAAREAGILMKIGVPGAAVLYTNGRTIPDGRYAGQPDMVHIGTMLRNNPPMAWEGNTSLGKFDRNGFTLALKAIDVARVAGYVLPYKA